MNHSLEAVRRNAIRRACFGVMGVVLSALAACDDDSSSAKSDVTVQSQSSSQTQRCGAGSECSVAIESADLVTFTSVSELTWTWEVDGAVVAVEGETPNEKRLRISNAGAVGSTATVSLCSRDSDCAVVVVTVAPTRYADRERAVGLSVAWAARTTYRDGSGADQKRVELIESVAGDGAYRSDTSIPWEPSSSTAWQDVDAHGATTARYRIWYSIYDDLADPESGCKYAPGLPLRSFPLYVGKAWHTTWSFTSCDGPTASGTGQTDGSVEAVERITVPAGTFDTLRVRIVSSPGDVAVTFGSAPRPLRETRTCWWAVDLRRDVRCEIDYDYEAASRHDLMRETMEATEFLDPPVKP